MAGDDALLDVLRRFARRMTRGYDPTDVLYELCDHVAEIVGATGAGVALVADDGVLRFVTAVGEGVSAAERAQETMQDGPCVAAMQSSSPVAVRDIADHAERWPEYADALREQGLTAVLGLPLLSDERRIGSLDVYDQQDRDWSEAEIGAAALLADVATAYVLNATELEGSRRTAAQLQRALDSRIVIEQAKGMLAERLGTTPERAFAHIRSHARAHNRNLREVCQSVIDGETPA